MYINNLSSWKRLAAVKNIQHCNHLSNQVCLGLLTITTHIPKCCANFNFLDLFLQHKVVFSSSIICNWGTSTIVLPIYLGSTEGWESTTSRVNTSLHITPSAFLITRLTSYNDPFFPISALYLQCIFPSTFLLLYWLNVRILKWFPKPVIYRQTIRF